MSLKSYNQTKKQTQKILKSVLDDHLESVFKTPGFKDLEKLVNEFVEDCYKSDLDFYFDESGFLNSGFEVTLADDLCFDDSGELVMEIIEAVTDRLSEDYGVYFESTQYSQGPRDFRISQCLGEPIIYNESPKRNCYAIYSPELGLKIDSVIKKEHGFALIEQAMRKAGVFENIVSTDYYGMPSFLSVPKEIRELSDSDLIKLIDSIEQDGE